MIEFREPGIDQEQSSPLPSIIQDPSAVTIQPSTVVDDNVARENRDVSDKNENTNIVHSPSIPYFEHNINFGKPCDIIINGMILDPFNKYFVINLANTNGDRDAKKQNIPIHISIRVDQSKIVRNSLINGVWGQEETCLEGTFPLTIGSMFEVFIQNQNESVSISINGQLCCQYKHRHDPKTIDTIEINGSVRLDSIRYRFN